MFSFSEKDLTKNSTSQFVAISDAFEPKGRKEVVGCGPAGRVRVARSNRDASETNQKFDFLRRGAFFELSNLKLDGPFSLDRLVMLKKKDEVKIL